MAPKLDLAIIKALSLDPTKTTIASHGGSGFASTAKITSVADKGRETLFFVKTGRGRDSEVMFAGEHASLNAIHSTVPTLSPKSHAHGPLSETPNTYFLATDFLDLSPIRRTSLSNPTTRSTTKKSTPPLPLAKKLALLHTTPAPIPQGYDTAQFGFPLPTCCGSREQNNSYKEKWSEFYAENRLRSISRFAESKNGKDFELTSLVDRVIESVVPRLIGEGHLKDAETGGDIRPVVVHGDLWSGNAGRGVICSSFPESSGSGPGDEEGEGGGKIQDVVFDPSSCYAHAEYDFGIMKMFGGFGAQFWKEYYEGKGKDHPVEEWDDRVELYELYHHLNHYALFGGSYKSGAVSIMKRLLRKYG